MKKTSSFTTLVLLSLAQDRKSTRLNSSHVRISYAVFCLKKKKQQKRQTELGTTPPLQVGALFNLRFLVPALRCDSLHPLLALRLDLCLESRRVDRVLPAL